mgnify:CR=1 FL=1
MMRIKLDEKVRPGLKDLYCPYKAIRLSRMSVGEYIRMIAKVADKFLIGTEAHSLIYFNSECKKEVVVEYKGHRFRIDAVCNGNEIYEVKLAVGEKYREWYLWTLRKYMCMWIMRSGVDRVTGYLVGILDGRVVTVELDKAKAEKECEELDRRIEEFEKGVEVKVRGSHCEGCMFKSECNNAKLTV